MRVRYATTSYGAMVNTLDSESRGPEFVSWWNLFLEEENWSVILLNLDHETQYKGYKRAACACFSSGGAGFTSPSVT